MPPNVGETAGEKSNSKAVRHASSSDSTWYRWKLPAPVKRIFDEFPLQTYPANELPQRTNVSRNRNTLYLFATKESARSGAPSFNPGCLKWQTYLKFQNIEFQCLPSSNHASPTGALPFLLPATSTLEPQMPISSSRIQRWIRDEKSVKGPKNNEFLSQGKEASALADNEDAPRNKDQGGMDMRYDAYMALIDHRIRNAYLYSLYLSPLNFSSVASALYIKPATTNPLVRLVLSHQLRSAAEAELLKQATVIDIQSLYREGEKAFLALSTLLGDHEYFFKEKRPTLFDASVFAYTNILLDDGLRWQIRHLQDALGRHENLVNHRKRIRERYYGSSPTQ